MIVFLLCFVSLYEIKQVRSQEEQKYFFTINCAIPRGNFAMEKLGEILVDELAKIGIEFIPYYTDWASLGEILIDQSGSGATWDEGGADMFFMGTSYHRYDADGIRKYFYGGYDPEGAEPTFGMYRMPWHPELQFLIEQGLKETDETRRMEIYQKASEIMYEEQFVSPYMINDRTRIMADDFKGFSENRGGYIDYPQDWYIEGTTLADDVSVTIAYPYPTKTLNAMFANEAGSMSLVKAPIFDLLVGRDLSFAPTPEIAESWAFSNEGKTVTFTIRDDVYFHDGEQLTSEDVLWSYEMHRNPEVGSYDYTWTDPIESVEAPGEFTFVVNLKYPTPTIITQIATRLIIMPAHQFEGVAPEELYTFEYDNPIGSGPYKFVRWVEGDFIELQANENFMDGEPLIDHLFIKVIPDASTAHSALEAGEIKFSLVPASPTEQGVFKDKPGFRFEKYPGYNVQWVDYNRHHPVLDNKYVRWAISHMIPREHLANDIAEGLVSATSQVYAPETGGGVLGYNPNLPEIEYSVDKAWEYMEMAGYLKEYIEPVEEDTSGLYLYAAVGLIIGAIVGAGATFFLKKS
jgi:ABC-type transport system substrate-binding protein